MLACLFCCTPSSCCSPFPWSTSGPFQHYCFPRVFFHGVSAFLIISQKCASLYFSTLNLILFLDYVFKLPETFSHLHYFSDFSSSMSKKIPLSSSTTSAAHFCLYRETVLNSTCHFMKSLSVRVRTLHTTPASQSGKADPRLHVWQPQWRICFYSPQLSPYAKPDPWILLPVLHIAVPHSFLELPCSSHSSARSFCKTNPFITMQFHPFLDRASTSSPTCVIWSKVLIKSAWQNLSFKTWYCLLLLDLLQTSLPRSEARNCLTWYRAIHNFVTLRPVDFISPPPRSSFLGHLFFLFTQKRRLWLCTAHLAVYILSMVYTYFCIVAA